MIIEMQAVRNDARQQGDYEVATWVRSWTLRAWWLQQDACNNHVYKPSAHMCTNQVSTYLQTQYSHVYTLCMACGNGNGPKVHVTQASNAAQEGMQAAPTLAPLMRDAEEPATLCCM